MKALSLIQGIPARHEAPATGHEKKSSLKRNLMSEAVGLGAMESDISSIEILRPTRKYWYSMLFPSHPADLDRSMRH